MAADAHLLDVRVFYLWESGTRPTHDPQFGKTFSWDVDLLQGYDSEFVPNVSPFAGTSRFRGLQNPELPRRLAAWRPDGVLLFGYAFESHLRTLAWARLHGIPVVFRGDSHLLGRKHLPWRTRVALRLLYAQFRAVTYVGAANREYFTTLGVPSRRLFFAPHAVDHTLFDPSRAGPRAEAQRIRTELNLREETRVVLFAGKLVASKQPRELLDAFLSLGPLDAALIFVGEGEEKPGLLAAAQRTGIGNIRFLPFANQSEMPSRYLLADVFALPSRGFYETWGLAVNEAMHMGVPALVSDRVGCQRDLVTDGETGWVFRADDPSHLRAKLALALTADRPSFQQSAGRRIANYTYQQATDGLLDALRAAIAKPSASRA